MGATGRFEGNSIVVDLEVVSPMVEQIRKTLSVEVDTGCSSDLILTYKEAFPLALALVGIQDYTIADGSKVAFFECLGKVKFGKQEVLCSISIRPKGSLLMGVSLMKKLNLKLNIDFKQNVVKFVESRQMTKIRRKV